MTERTSAIPGFHSLKPAERLDAVKAFALLDDEEASLLAKAGGLDMDTANRMIENVVGQMPLPMGIATNFKVNGKDYLVPMCIEEPSVVAAASKAAKLARECGGFSASTTDPVMTGQIQVVGVDDCQGAAERLKEKKDILMQELEKADPGLSRYGGGPRGIEPRVLKTDVGEMLIVHVDVDVRDAMGANAVNTMLEKIAPKITEITGGRHLLKIITNLATGRMARSEAVWKNGTLGDEAIDGVLNAYRFAEHDQYRCTTHNKGIMNGIDAVCIATGNDWRAVEAGAHSYACISGKYRPLTKYWKDKKGDLHGSTELPLAVATVGGATKVHPIAKVSQKILGVGSAQELAGVIASVGLAQNFAALYAMATEGIQKGHMKLHASNLAIQAGAIGNDIEEVVRRMIEEGNISEARAREILDSK